MGEISEMILDGILCETCGGVIDGTAPGYPRKCSDCADESSIDYDYEFNIACIKQFSEEIIEKGDKAQMKKLRNICSRIQRKVKVKINE